MKKLNIIALTLLTTFAFIGCQDDEHNHLKLDESTFISPHWEKVELAENPLIITQQNLKDIGGTWSWTEANFGIESPITYEIQIDNNEAFETANTLAKYTTANKELTFTNDELNDAVQSYLPKDAKPEDMVEGIYYIRIKAYLGSAGVLSTLVSDVKSIKFTPTVASKSKPALYIVGNALVDWNNDFTRLGDDLQVFFADDSNSGNQKYTYTGYFKNTGENGLKLPTVAGNWDTAYGVEGSTLKMNATDIPAPSISGVYTLSVDLETLSYSYEPYTKPIDTYMQVGIVGESVGSWDNDVVMNKIADHVWVAKDIELTANEDGLKFRANGSWDKNWGGKEGSMEFPFGIASGDKNIPVTVGGKYYIAFNSLTAHYVIILMDDLPKK